MWTNSAENSLIEVFLADYTPTSATKEPLVEEDQDVGGIYDFTGYKKHVPVARKSLRAMIEAYLREPTFAIDDPIAYWQGELAANRRAPLAQMAIDYLSAPCMSFPFNSADFSLTNIL